MAKKNKRIIGEEVSTKINANESQQKKFLSFSIIAIEVGFHNNFISIHALLKTNIIYL